MDVTTVRPPTMSGPEVKALRHKLGLTVDQLAVCIGVSSTTINNWQKYGSNAVGTRALQYVEQQYAAKTAAKTADATPENTPKVT